MFVLDVKLGSTDGNLSKWEGILDGEYVDVLDGDWDNDGIHGIIDLNIVQSDMLVNKGNMHVKKELDIVLFY